MRLSRHTKKIAFTVLGVSVILCGTFFVRTSSDVTAHFLNSQVFYAEVPSPAAKLTLSAPVGGEVRVPILVYHIVRPSYPTDSQEVIALAHTPEVFDAQMQYLADQSDDAADRYVFSYTISIRNSGNVPAQLISRHWIITDARNQVQEVRGLGVVGAQPLLKPGESFEYTSGTALATPVGTMRGSYQMVAEDGTQFQAPIPEFTLSVPRVLH